MRVLLLLMFSILFLIYPYPASAGYLDPITEAGANMVKSGLDSWLFSAGDSMMAWADNNTNLSSHPTQMAFFDMITYSYNPLENPAVIEIIKSTSIIFLFLFAIFVLAGMGYVTIHKYNPDAGQAIDFAFFDERGFDYKDYLKTLGSVFFLILFGFTAIGVLILISEILSEMMTSTVLNSLISAPNSGVVYFFMALAYLLLALFMGIRILLLSLISSMFLLLVAAWAFHILREVITTVFIYFFVLIFMQPVLISIASVGVMVIEYIHAASFGIGTNLLYTCLVIILVASALVLILGPATVGKMIRLGIKGAAL